MQLLEKTQLLMALNDLKISSSRSNFLHHLFYFYFLSSILFFKLHALDKDWHSYRGKLCSSTNKNWELLTPICNANRLKVSRVMDQIVRIILLWKQFILIGIWGTPLSIIPKLPSSYLNQAISEYILHILYQSMPYQVNRKESCTHPLSVWQPQEISFVLQLLAYLSLWSIYRTFVVLPALWLVVFQVCIMLHHQTYLEHSTWRSLFLFHNRNAHQIWRLTVDLCPNSETRCKTRVTVCRINPLLIRKKARILLPVNSASITVYFHVVLNLSHPGYLFM